MDDIGGTNMTAVLEAPGTRTTLTAADIAGLIRQSLAEARGDIGRFNLLIAGKTGAGKSSLINAIFGWEIAATGTGRPVTTTTTEYEHPNLPLTVLDTRGIETGENRKDLVDRLVTEITRRQKRKVRDQVHVAWYCVRASDHRLEAGQEDVIRGIAATGVPVVLVLTQVATQDDTLDPDALAFLEELRKMELPVAKIVLTAAVDHPFHGPKHGLNELLEATAKVAPKGAENALIASQQIDLNRKRNAAKLIIGEHVILAAAAAATPIPFSDAALIIPMQIAMIGRITAVWGLDIAVGSLVSVIGSALLAGGAALVGREIVANVLKFIPVVGTILGDALNATVASTLTTAVGTAWTSLAEKFAAHPEALEAMSANQIRDAFRTELRTKR
jgi:uncharacterized protein (DUF697 family)/GTPase SAR1 family protein